MAVNLGDSPLAGFGQPIELLKDCHRRIEHFLGVLSTVTDRFGDGELPPEGRQALTASLDYFSKAAPLHTADEEQSLLPRMRGGGAEVQASIANLNRLEQDHCHIQACHAQVEQLARQWLDAGRIERANHATLRSLLDELATVYAEHIRLEEEEIFVLAARMLNAEQLREMGDEMSRRRGLTGAAPDG